MSTTTRTPKKHTQNTGNDSRSVSAAEMRRLAAEHSESGRLLDLSLLPANSYKDKRLRHTDCPICGADLIEDGGDSLEGGSGLADHLARPDHRPEDLGLLPADETPEFQDLTTIPDGGEL